jgi:hypothetical protein
MSRNLLTLILLQLLIGFLDSQTITVRAVSDDEQNQTYWHIYGTSDLSDGTVLVGRLLFEDAEIPRSRFQTSVNHGAFEIAYGPVLGKMLNGTYHVEIALDKSLQPVALAAGYKEPLLVQKKPFYLGSVAEERMVRLAYRDFLQKMGDRYRRFHKELREKSESYLQKQTLTLAEQEELRAWLKKLAEEKTALCNETEPYGFAKVFMPYCRASMLELQQIEGMTESLVTLRTGEIFLHFSLPLPAPCRDMIRGAVEIELHDKALRALRAMRKKKNYHKTKEYQEAFALLKKVDKEYNQFCRELDFLQQSILRKMQDMLAREPVGENFQYPMLAQDIQWCEEKLKQIKQKYQAMQASLPQGNWEDWSAYMKTVASDLVYWHTKISAYDHAPLVLRYPQMDKVMARLCANLQKLAARYTRDLYQRAQKTPSADLPVVAQDAVTLEKSLEQDLQYLQSILAKEKELAAQRRHDATQKLDAMIARWRKLYDDLEGMETQLQNSDKKEKELRELWLNWQKTWYPALKTLRQTIKDMQQDTTIIEFFADGKLAVATHHLYLAYLECQSIAGGDRTLTRFANVRKHKYFAMRLVLQMEMELHETK